MPSLKAPKVTQSRTISRHRRKDPKAVDQAATHVTRDAKARLEEETLRKYSHMFTKTKHRIVLGDSRHMNELNNDSIHLIVTSPPYFNAKEYSQWESLDDYLTDMRKTLCECYRVLQPSRKFCLNISDLPERASSGVRWISLGAEMLTLCQDIGFEIVDRIFWFKTPLKGFQYGSLPLPPSPLINDSIEYIYVLRKPGKPDYSYVSKKAKEASRLRRDEYVEYTKQIWSIRRVREKDNIDGHVAPYPEELPERCIKMYSFVGDTVLDPFGGRGTTTKVALANKRNSVLYEIHDEYLSRIKKMINTEQTTLFNNAVIRIQKQKK